MRIIPDDIKSAIWRSFRRSYIRRLPLPSCRSLRAVAPLATGERPRGSSSGPYSQTVSAILLALIAVSPSSANQPPGAGDDTAKRTEVQQFDDWQLRCTSPAPSSGADKPSAPACEIGQPLMVDVDGKPVELLSLAVTRASDKAEKAKWAMVVLTPLDVQLNLALSQLQPSGLLCDCAA